MCVYVFTCPFLHIHLFSLSLSYMSSSEGRFKKFLKSIDKKYSEAPVQTTYITMGVLYLFLRVPYLRPGLANLGCSRMLFIGAHYMTAALIVLPVYVFDQGGYLPTYKNKNGLDTVVSSVTTTNVVGACLTIYSLVTFPRGFL